MKKSGFILGAVLSMVLLISATKSSTVYIDLSPKGIPITVDAPSGSKIRAGLLDGMEMENVTTLSWEINKGDFSLDVSMEDAPMKRSHKEYVKYARNVVEMDKSFVEYVEWDENGFLVKLSFNGAIEYDFYHLVSKDNRAIEFSVGLAAEDYGINNIRDIYHAAKTAK